MLCTVAAALVLAKYMWPVVVSHDALENVWHAFEYFGNTLIFMLAGVITRRAMVTDNIRMQVGHALLSHACLSSGWTSWSRWATGVKKWHVARRTTRSASFSTSS